MIENPFSRPIRVRLSRAKGFRLPPRTIVVARPGRWGNIFVVTDKVKPGTRTGGRYIAVPTDEDAVECHRLMLQERPDLVSEARELLRGSNLACWCALDGPCHGDNWLEVANGD